MILAHVVVARNIKNVVVGFRCVMSKLKDGIYGFAVGDALGVPVEFKSRAMLEKDPVTKMVGYGSYEIEEGVYSDDTAMTLATLDSISKMGKIDCNDMMDRFCAWVNNGSYSATGVVFDIGITTKYAIMKYQDEKVDATLCGSNAISSNGNGSLMRMFPIAYYCFFEKKEEKEIFSLVKEVSSMTHAHEISIMGCYLYTLYLIFLLEGQTKNDAYQKLKEKDYSFFKDETRKYYHRLLEDDISNVSLEKIASSGFVVDTLEAVFYNVLTCNSYQEAVLKAVNMGDDTDTVGAITGSIAGVLYGYQEIPLDFLNTLKGKDKIDTYLASFEKVFPYEKRLKL